MQVPPLVVAKIITKNDSPFGAPVAWAMVRVFPGKHSLSPAEVSVVATARIEQAQGDPLLEGMPVPVVPDLYGAFFDAYLIGGKELLGRTDRDKASVSIMLDTGTPAERKFLGDVFERCWSEPQTRDRDLPVVHDFATMMMVLGNYLDGAMDPKTRRRDDSPEARALWTAGINVHHPLSQALSTAYALVKLYSGRDSG